MTKVKNYCILKRIISIWNVLYSYFKINRIEFEKKKIKTIIEKRLQFKLTKRCSFSPCWTEFIIFKKSKEIYYWYNVFSFVFSGIYKFSILLTKNTNKFWITTNNVTLISINLSAVLRKAIDFFYACAKVLYSCQIYSYIYIYIAL